MPGPLMPESESSLPPELLLSTVRLQEHFFLAQHQAKTRARTMTKTKSSTPPPPWTCSTVRTKMPAAEDLSCPEASPVAVVTVGESTATSRGPHILQTTLPPLCAARKVRVVQGPTPGARACHSKLPPPPSVPPPPPPPVCQRLLPAAPSLHRRLGGAGESR